MSDGPEPTPADLHGKAIPAAYRRAPRTERFILTGVGIGALVGVVLGLILPAGTGIGRGTGAILVGLAGALAGGLITGVQAAYLEYASGRSVERQRERILAQSREGDDAPDVWRAVAADAWRADAAPAPSRAADPSVDPSGVDPYSPPASAQGGGDGAR